MEYMANLWEIPTYHINTLNDLYELIKKEKTGIALCDDVGKAISDFYSDDYSKEIEKIICDYTGRDLSNESLGLILAGVS